MVQLQANSRYYSLRGLSQFLQAKFPGHTNFKIKQVSDGYFSFEAPRHLTAVSHRTIPQPLNALLMLKGRMDVGPSALTPQPVNANRTDSNSEAKD